MTHTLEEYKKRKVVPTRLKYEDKYTSSQKIKNIDIKESEKKIELHDFILKIFKTAFCAGRLYTFENKDVSLEKLDDDVLVYFYRYFTMSIKGFDDGKSWEDEIHEFGKRLGEKT